MRPSLVDRARIWVARQFFPAQYRQALTSRNSQAYAAISGLYQNADQLGATLRGQRISRLVRSYGELVWVYVCVTKNAQSIAGVPWKAQRENRDGEAEDLPSSHELNRLLAKPNKFQSGYDLKESVISSLELFGEAFIQLDRGVSGVMRRPRSMYCLPLFDDDTMEIVVDPRSDITEDGYIAGYIYKVQGREIGYRPEEIIHIKYHNPFNPLRGLSPLRALAMTLEHEYASKHYNVSFFRNAARPEGHWETDDAISETKRARLNKLLQLRTRSKQKSFLMNGIRWVPTQLPPKDVEFLSLMKLDREEILPAFGVRPVVAGILEKNPQANAEVQWRDYYQATVQPKGKKITDKLDNELASSWGEGIFIAHDWSAVPVLQEHFTEKVTNAQKLHMMGVPFNEINRRLDMGFDPLPWGDVVLVNPLLAPIDQVVNQSFEPERKFVAIERTDLKLLESPRPYRGMPKETLDRFRGFVLERNVSRQDRLADQFTQKVADFFHRQQLRTVRLLKEHARSIREEAPAGVDISLIFPLNEEVERMVEEVSREIATQGVLQGMLGFAADYGFSEDDLDFTGQRVLEFIEAEGFRHAKNVTETTQDRLIETLKEAVDQGESIPQMAARIEEVFTNRASSAETIARTETLSAANFGNHESALQSQARSKSWLDSGDLRVRHEHRIIDSQTDGNPISIGQPFELADGSRLMYPGDSSLGASISQIANCRCVVLYFFA